MKHIKKIWMTTFLHLSMECSILFCYRIMHGTLSRKGDVGEDWVECCKKVGGKPNRIPELPAQRDVVHVGGDLGSLAASYWLGKPKVKLQKFKLTFSVKLAAMSAWLPSLPLVTARAIGDSGAGSRAGLGEESGAVAGAGVGGRVGVWPKTCWKL